MDGYIQKKHQGPTKRFVQTLTLNSDEEARREYIKWHSQEYSWKEIRDGIREVGILEMEIYILGNLLVMIVDTSSSLRLEMVRQFWARFFSLVSIFVSLMR